MKLLIQISGVAKSYGPQVIFDDASAAFSLAHKVGVIGRNGAGKSTLCKIILGEEAPDAGEIIRHTELRLAYLEQHDPFRHDETVEQFLVRHTGLEGWRCGQIAGRFELKRELFEATPIGQLSGGFQTRIKLAAMLLAEPNFLILDEPTNFLDLDTQLLLESALRDYSGGFLIVSHDREFLKRTCSHTLEVARGGLTLFPGALEEYFTFREEQLENVRRQNAKTEARRRQLQTFVDKNRVRASTARQAQSKQKQLEKLEFIEIGHSLAEVSISLPEVSSTPGPALHCEDLTIGYPGKTVASKIHLDFQRGERVAIVGANGQGKTTFLRTLAGELEPRGGSFAWSSTLDFAYYAQHKYGTLPEELDVETYLRSEAVMGTPRQTILDLAGCFLFRGDDIEKRIGVLSGGERARLCLAGLLLSGKPLLLLDEPTNHLDFETVEALGFALADYGGTVFFTSHDRTFVSLVATSVVEVSGGRVASFPGDYATYVYQLERRARDSDRSSGGKGKRKSGKSSKNDHAARKERRSQLRKLKNQVARLEKEMARREAEKQALLAAFESDPSYDPERQTRLQALSDAISADEEAWLELQAGVEELQAED